MKSLFKKSIGLFLLAVTLFSTSCRKDDFDNPPAGGADPDLTVNQTIADLKAGYQFGQFKTITEDWIIAGVVTADDRSGNFYKTIIIQDATAAIAIRIDLSDYYTKYPIGRRVFVKLKGLVLGDYNDLIQLGGFIDNSNPAFPSVEPIPLAMINDYLFPGQYNLTVDPEVVTINQLVTNTFDYQNKLIKLYSVEFDPADTSLTYADVANQASANRALNDCSGGTIDLRSSNYATFAGDTLPNGKGTLTGIFSVYGNFAQMYIRDTYDVQLDSTRCNGGGGGGGPATPVSISYVRGLYTGSTISSLPALKIKGVVISDKSTGNFVSKNITIQDSTGGIVVRFTADHAFNLGDQVEIVVSGTELSVFTGVLQVNLVPLANASLLATGVAVTPRIATVADINANFNLWESTLVKVLNSNITSTTGAYGASAAPYPDVFVDDGTGSIELYTRGAATFSSSSVPAGTVSVTAIVVPYVSNSNPTLIKELMIRNLSDIQ
ncbi:MAG: DUF5689 domain-containing protein [Bacteroidota bacterium]